MGAPARRWERLPEMHEAFMHLGCAMIYQRYLRTLLQLRQERGASG